MAKAKLNLLMVEISGTMGGFVFKRSRNGETIVCRRPRKSNSKPSEAQKAQRERFKLASQYAKAAMADPLLRPAYEEIAAKEGMNAFNVARSECCKSKYLLSNR